MTSVDQAKSTQEDEESAQYLPQVLTNQLYSSSSSSPQPNALIRTALFTPKKRNAKSAEEFLELTEAFREVKYFNQEGYDSAIITGPTLSIQSDFKVWCGIIFAFSKYGYDSNEISLKFTEFAGLCGYKPTRFNKALRTQIEKSLFRLQAQKIHMKTKSAKKSIATGLILRSEYDTEKDTVKLMADSNLWELYTLDHQVLISLNVLAKIPYSEAAQCLYLFFASLPENPLPVSLQRMRSRLRLNMSEKESNRSVRNAIKKLESTGYLKGSWTKNFHKQTSYIIHSRNKKIKI